MNDHIRIDHNRIIIDGRPRVLLCASLFPFRVPRAQWEQRLAAVRRLGYHAIDVYVPWNYHETAPGVWNFDGQHDIEKFLRLTHQTGLYAMVRPGPYICSEWDGGAIPAWVSVDPSSGGGEALRQNDPRFLEAVRGWYDRILPIIARQQYGHGGPVIAVQADNELDFFACRDPRGYIGALAAMMRHAGIDVPIVACAGQGDMERASGGANGVITAVNLYGNDNDADLDAHIRYYRQAADRNDIPLIVTETNRWHRTLRRMVGNGARFVGPFLQVSGWDFDYGTSVNNWGSLESYMTHDYDFGGVIDPAGQERPDADEARRLSAIIEALGTRLAAADVVDGGQWLRGVPVSVLRLHGGGELLTVTNLNDHAISLRLPCDTVPDIEPCTLTLPGAAAAMVTRDLPVDDAVVLSMTTGELISLRSGTQERDESVPDDADENITCITLSAPPSSPGRVRAVLTPSDDGALALAVHDEAHDESGDLAVHAAHGGLIIDGVQGDLTFTACGGRRRYRLVITQPVRLFHATAARERRLSELVSTSSSAASPAWTPIPESKTGGRAMPMEDVGVYIGAMRYEACNQTAVDTPDADADRRDTDVIGVILRDAADTISVRYGNRHGNVVMPWRANGGCALYLPFDAPQAAGGALEVVTRIWGHSNFDDSRLPSLRLDAKRGMTGAIMVSERHDLGSGWLVGHDDGADAGLDIGANPRPRVGMGGWSTTVWPHRLTYTRSLRFGDTAAALHIDHGQARCDVRLNGSFIGTLTPLQPTLWLGDIHDGDELTVTVSRAWGESAGHAVLLTGREVSEWRMATQGLRELRAAADAAFDVGASTAALPVTVAPGAGRWLRVSAEALDASACSSNTVVRFDGDGLQLTAFTDDHCLGRVILGGLPGTTFAGGRGDLFLVPGNEGDLRLYAEAIRDVPGRLDAVILGGPVDRVR